MPGRQDGKTQDTLRRPMGYEGQAREEIGKEKVSDSGGNRVRDTLVPKEAPHSCGAGECEALGNREALSKVGPFSPRQECRGSLPLADLLARGGPEAEALEQEILTRLVALNHERAAEEKRGLIRWLRPEFQAPGQADPDQRPLEQTEMEGVDTSDPSSLIPQPSSLETWPEEAPAQVSAVRKLLPTVGKDPEALSACFASKSKKRTEKIAAIIAILESFGHV